MSRSAVKPRLEERGPEPPRSDASGPEASRPAGPDPRADADWMRDREVIHKIVVALDQPHPAVSDLLDQLARAQGRLHALSVRPVAGRFEAVLQATRLTPDAARRLVDGYAGLPEVASASIEHMLVR